MEGRQKGEREEGRGGGKETKGWRRGISSKEEGIEVAI